MNQGHFKHFLLCSFSELLFFCVYYSKIFLYFFFINLFIYCWLRWVFVAARGLSLVETSGGYSSLSRAGFSLWWLPLLWSISSRRAGSVVVARGL